MIAHRGGGTVAPENTLAGLAAAKQAGYGGVEFDVMLAADGVPVLMHDERLGRTVRGKGAVADVASAELCAMDAGSWFSPRFAGETVPRYKAALDYCLQHGLWMNVEIKPSAGRERETGEIVARLTREWLGPEGAGQVLFSSFSVAALQAASESAPGIPRGWLLGDVPKDWRDIVQLLQARSLHVQHRRVNAALAEQVHKLGLGLFCYTVNSITELRRLRPLQVDAICTDRIDVFAADALATAAV